MSVVFDAVVVVIVW